MMKKINLLSLSLLIAILIGCDDQIPMNKLMYPQSVYLVGAKGFIIDRDLNIGYLQDTIFTSVAISGSLPTSKDVVVEIEEFPLGIDNYNSKELGSDDILYQNLDKSIYSFPNQYVTVKQEEEYGVYPIYVKPGTLHIDSLYMISLKIKSTTEYTLSEEDTVLLVRFNLMNDYSGQYYMDGIIKEYSPSNDSVVYKSPRVLQAVDDGKTVRMYHEKNEYTKGSTDYRPDYCFKITINSDNSLTLSTWQNFEILDGGGTYYPELEVYDLWYNFIENGKTKKTRGFVYKERKNDDEQRIINDWMEENRKFD